MKVQVSVLLCGDRSLTLETPSGSPRVFGSSSSLRLSAKEGVEGIFGFGEKLVDVGSP